MGIGIGGSFSHMIDHDGCPRPGSCVRWEWGQAADTVDIINHSMGFGIGRSFAQIMVWCSERGITVSGKTISVSGISVSKMGIGFRLSICGSFTAATIASGGIVGSAYGWPGILSVKMGLGLS